MTVDRQAILAGVDLGALLEEIVSARGLRRRGKQYPCPKADHEQTGGTPPVAVAADPAGYGVWKCHGCGAGGSAIDALLVSGRAADLTDAFAQLSGDRNGKPHVVERYGYVDEQGELLYEVERMEPKGFRQRRPRGKGWTYKLDGVRRVPYHLPQLIAAVQAEQPIWIVEGERDVHAVEAAGATATCNSGGAGKWRAEFSEFLEGVDVVIVSDQDKVGREHAEAIAASLKDVARVRVVKPVEGHDAADHLAKHGHGLDEFVTVEEEPEPVNGPALALSQSRVDLIKLIEEGIPERTFLPGCEPWFIAGKRYLMPAAAGTGKSLAALIVAVAIVENGGTVAILDVENGSDEYARRLADILTDRAPEVAAACQERLRYYEWPSLSLSWTASDWATAVTGCDLVVFDSSRLTLSSVGLAEDKADDYSVFVDKLLLPLAKAGISTLVLDNTGHEEQDRSRGTSAKGDLNEVSYALKVGAPFDRDRAGHLRLIRVRQRFAGLPKELRIQLGAGSYSTPEATTAADDDTSRNAFRPTVLMERVSRAIEQMPGLSKRDIRTAVKGEQNDYKDLAVVLLIGENYVEDRGTGKRGHPCEYHSVKPYREVNDQPCLTVPEPCLGTVEGDRASVPLPFRAPGTVPGSSGHPNRASDSEPPFTGETVADETPLAEEFDEALRHQQEARDE